MTSRPALARAAALAALLALPFSSHAVFRAYVSSTGNDANPCTLQQPCRLLPRALTVVDPKGEIWMLDSANYNTATVAIGKSVTIQAVPGAVGSLVSTGGGALSVGTNNIDVTLRNVQLVPLDQPSTGIGISATNARVHLEKCVIEGMDTGIFMLNDSRLSVVDTVIRRNNNGIDARGGRIHVSRSHFLHQAFAGIFLDPLPGAQVSLHVDNSVASDNGTGLRVQSLDQGRVARVFATRFVTSGNSDSGFHVTATNPDSVSAEVSDSVASGNGLHGFANVGATLYSAGNNRAVGNGGDDVHGPITPMDSH